MTRIAAVILGLLISVASIADPLPSWSDGDAKTAIVSFVSDVTDSAHEQFVPVRDRIAVFDNDGTLWAENPFYLQAIFALDVFADRAKDDPSLITSDVLRAAAGRDLGGVLKSGEEGLLELIDASHSNISVAEFQSLARTWLRDTRHPQHNRKMSEMVYQPMLELLAYLRDNDFQTYIVSGGGIDFMRAFAESVYGIPPYQVIGSVGNHSYLVRDGEPVVLKDAGISFIDDKAGKPIAISRHIGKRPIFAAGNSGRRFPDA